MAILPTLLFTGFEPFGGDQCNPSGLLARALHGRVLLGRAVIHSLVLPVSGPPAWAKLSRAIRKIQPHWIIATGVSGREEISVESTAWNEANYRLPDNSGRQPRGSLLLRRGPASLATGFSENALLGLTSAPFHRSALGLPIRSSTDPGRFVCNYLYYRLLHLTENPTHTAHQQSLFLHLPCIPEMSHGPQDSRFFYPLAALQEIVLTLLEQIAEGARKP